MRMKIALITSALASTLLVVAACGDDNLGGADSPLSEMNLAKETPKRGPHGRHERMIQAAMEQLDLRPDQRATVQKLHKDVRVSFLPVRAAAASAMLQLGSAATTGTLDSARLAALANQIEARMLAVQPVVVSSLNTLHRTLDAGQRARLVQIVKDHHHKRQGWHKGRRHGPKMMRKLAKHLGLTAEQQDTLRTVFRSQFSAHKGEWRARRTERRQKMKAAMVAFKSDSFDAARLGLFDHSRGMAAKKVQHLVQLANRVLPVLTVEQRGKLAGKLKQKAERIKQAPALAPAQK